MRGGVAHVGLRGLSTTWASIDPAVAGRGPGSLRTVPLRRSATRAVGQAMPRGPLNVLAGLVLCRMPVERYGPTRPTSTSPASHVRFLLSSPLERERSTALGDVIVDLGCPDPRPLVRDVLLRDGSTLRLQAPTPVDLDDIKAFYDGLSPESRYFRFHGFGRTDLVAREEAEATGVDRMALISRHDGQVLAVASYVGLREPGVAEVAFAVADDDQGRGIGMRMLEQLAEIAADRGDPPFRCGGDGQQWADVGGVRARRLRRAASGFVWRVDGVARYHPDGGGAGADRRARPFRRDRIVTTSPRAVVGSSCGRRGDAGQCRPGGAGEHHRGRLCRVS